MRRTASHTLGTFYLRAIPTAGALILVGSLLEIYWHRPGLPWLLLSVLTALTSAYTIRIPGLVVRLSVSEPLVFLSTLLYGPAAGTVTAAVDGLVMSLRLAPRLRTPHRILFNVGGLTISFWPSAHLYFYLAGLDGSQPSYGPLETFVGPLYVFAACVFLANSWLVAIAHAIERRVSALSIWVTQFLWLSASYLASAAIAAILVVLTKTIDLALIGLLLPLIIVSFLVIKTSLGRLDDANRHLSEVNSLHLSTIETLAMAIDAKDQVTHGHIRRVQRYAVGLAKALGMQDERQLRAIEAAALLHDMGKLAIPEFILNKPGKLTSSEFGVMKTHAAVGADILSSIQFPYPVVPIVRHHHENWDGSGYPLGIRGANIPIGARILSVVDCYDALTSHRPYRPAMSAEHAIDVLTQRRGKMYDPLVVDAFVRAHAELCADAEQNTAPAVLLVAQQEAALQDGATETQLSEVAPIESLRLLACLAPFPAAPPLRSVCLQLVNSLRSIATFDTAAMFVVDDDSSDAEAIFVDGSGQSALQHSKVPVGDQLTGWVAAHRTAVWNSDAALDLASVTATSKLTLGSSVPLVVGDILVGALTLYGQHGQEITVGQRRALESLLPTISGSLHDALQRPWISIDCRQPHIRAAALSAMDALLSHSRQAAQSHGSALAISIESNVTGGPRAQLSLDNGVRSLAAMLSPRQSDNRCVLRFSSEHLLVCALDGATTEALFAEAEKVFQARLLNSFTLTLAPVRTPLELQDRVRRMLVTPSASKPLSGVRTQQT